MSKAVVYVAVIPEDTELTPVYPEERQAEIDRCSRLSVKQEKYFAWKLLQYAAENFFGGDFESLSFQKNQRGKWECDKFCFSISHSRGVAAVAVADKSIGVDIEAVRRHHDGMEQRVLTPMERERLWGADSHRAEEYVIEKWSQKESIFKTLDRPVFEPLKLETSDFSVVSRPVELNGDRFILSVCYDDTDKIEYWSFGEKVGQAFSNGKKIE